MFDRGFWQFWTHLTENSSLGLVPHLICPQAWSAGFSSNSFSQMSAPTSLSPYPVLESGSTEIPSVRWRKGDITQESHHSCGLGSHTTSTPNKNEPGSLISGWEACMWETLGGKLQEGLRWETSASPRGRTINGGPASPPQCQNGKTGHIICDCTWTSSDSTRGSKTELFLPSPVGGRVGGSWWMFFILLSLP